MPAVATRCECFPCTVCALRVGMGLVVDVHQLADGGVSVFLGGGEGLVAEEFLDGAKVGAISEEMGGKGVAERVRVQVPIDVDEADVFFDDAAYGALREAAAGVIEEYGFGIGGFAVAAAAAGGLQEQLLAQRPILFERFLGFRAVGDDALFVAFADYAQDTLFLVDVGVVQAGEFADAEARGVEQFEQGAVAAKEQAFVLKFGRFAGRGIRVAPGAFCGSITADAYGWTYLRELI